MTGVIFPSAHGLYDMSDATTASTQRRTTALMSRPDPSGHTLGNGVRTELCRGPTPAEPSKRDVRRAYLIMSAPALQATPSWSPVAPLQPIAPMILPPSISGKPPGDATGGTASSVAM